MFKDRVELAQVRDYDLQNYRFPRPVIAQLVAGLAKSEFSNSTDRSKAIPAETQVNILLNYYFLTHAFLAVDVHQCQLPI